ncbi:MAG: fibronectin type III domain-containing protein, partial [Chitinophagaceae bacterium]|nr:fibronectin type III domain-containing protein [Chitinophagaceae bacterium]
IFARVKYANNIGAPWNTLNGVTSTNLKDEFNNTTPIGINFSPNWWLPYNAGPTTGNNSGVYPDAVLNDFWYFGYYGGPETANVSVTGLNPAGKYNLTFYAGSVFGSVSDNGTTNYTVGNKTVSLYVQNNTRNTVSINDLVPDANGTITVNMSKAANTPIGYLNALVITSLYSDGTAPAAPKTLAALNVPGEGVKLTWADAAYNEGGYEVYRSTNSAGSFSLLNTTSSGATAYTDATVSGATQYFYTVRAINEQGVSAFTDTISVTTINRIPQLAPIADLQVKNNENRTINVTATDDSTDQIVLTASGLPSFVTFVDNGNGTGVLNIQPTSNLLGTFQNLKITAKDRSDSSRSVSFNLFVVDANISSTLVNFTSGDNVAPQPWNNMVIGYLPFAGTSIGNLKNEANVNTGITVTLTDAWQAASTTGQRMRNGTELYPEAVLRTGIYFTDNNNHRITVTGLNPAKRYNFQFLNSHGTSESVLTNFTVNGQTVSINGSYNSNKTVQINGIVPAANGQVVIDVTKAAGAVYGMISSLVIQSYTPGAVSTFGPADLRVTSLKTTSVSLQWQDRANNETGYEVWRSNGGGSYSLLETLPANATAYINTGLNRNSNYFYVVRAVNGASRSDYSNAVKAYTYASSVSINMSTSASIAPNPWNNLNWQLGVGSVWNNFIDDRLVPTNVGMVQTDAFDGLYNAGVNTGNNSGIYPDKVMAENFGLFPGATARIKITGLNYSKTYDFDIFASAQETYGDATAAYTINGKTYLLNANRNKSGILVISGITPDENGEVVLRVTTHTGSSFGLLGALVVNSYDATTATAPEAPGNISNARVAVATVNSAVETHISESPDATAALSAYPNPFAQTLTVSVPAHMHDNIQLSMIDVSGKVVYQKRYDNLSEGNNTIRIQNDRNAIVSGTYIIRVTYLNSNEQKIIKVIKR